MPVTGQKNLNVNGRKRKVTMEKTTPLKAEVQTAGTSVAASDAGMH